jgi:two-component system, NarL family, sensor histidine kinase DevS
MGSPDDPAQPPGPGGDADILRERDRIALGLQNEVIQRIFAIGLNLQGTAEITLDPLVRRRVEKAIDDLDHVVHIIRDTVFGLEAHLQVRGLRAGIMDLCEGLSPVPDVTFHGPVDGTLQPAASAELLEVLDDALAVIRHHWTPVLIDVTVADGAHVTMLQVMPLPEANGTREPDREFPALRGRAAEAGIRIEIEPGPESVQIHWHAA